MKRYGLRLTGMVLALGGGAVLSACADHYLAVDGDGHHTAAPPRPAVSEASPPIPVMPVKADTCGAAALQYLVGKPKTEVPVPVEPGNRRVYCSTCTITMDYRSNRLDVVFDQDTGLVTTIKCG